MDNMQFIRKYWLFLLVFAIGVVMGWSGHSFFVEPTVISKTITLPAKVATETKTKTEIVYIEKAPGEKTDLDVNIGKQELNVKVNGQDAVIKKDDNERFIFDKNKVVFDQTSKATIDIKVPTIDKTKRWGIGAGYGSNGIGYMLKVPAGKFDAWGYADKDTKAAGIMVGF
ncbi:MAG: hypothetical protein RSB52_08330 [Acidaminococcaceae bacterium]